MEQANVADICIISEGSYPYYSGGVAQWAHELIMEHKERTFHVLTLMPPLPDLTFRYKFPDNVIGHTVYVVQNLPQGAHAFSAPKETWEVVSNTLKGLMFSSNFENFQPILNFFRTYEKILGSEILLESQAAWEFLLKLYDETIPSGPFKDFFSTAFALSRSFFSILLPPLPNAKLYHALCTGYAGFLLYRAKYEKKTPCILTEQGIYTNERRIEVAMAEWIGDVSSLNLALEDKKKTLKDFWMNAFLSLAHACYISCDEIITTYGGNQELQIAGGADPKKMHNIVHGINPNDYSEIKRDPKHLQTIAFIGRVVSIKDVKTFIRACKIVNRLMPEVNFFILGPTNEEPDYYEECLLLVKRLGLEDRLKFFGRVNVKEYLSQIDLIVLTSISEAQPLVILEAGSIGIPFIATDVGACKELAYGKPNESPHLGQGGIVTPLANPISTASAIIKMLSEKDFYQEASIVIKKRIEQYYRFDQQHGAYRKFYEKYL